MFIRIFTRALGAILGSQDPRTQVYWRPYALQEIVIIDGRMAHHYRLVRYDSAV